MFFIKKKLVIYLYIFFVFLAFNFTEFSTNIATAKTFVVSNIEVEEKYNVNFNKLKINFSDIIVEKESKNTATSVLLGVLHSMKSLGTEYSLIIPSDHYISNRDYLWKS